MISSSAAKKALSDKKKRGGASTDDTVFKAPAIVRHPSSLTVQVGSRLRLTVNATGIPVPKFRWRHNGAIIEGVVSNVLVVPHMRLSNAGNYSAEAYNILGSDMSRSASITVLSAAATAEEENPGTVTIIPKHILALPGQAFMLRAELSDCNDPEPKYSWYRDGKRIKNVMGKELKVHHAKQKYVGKYTVVVETNAGIIQSDPVAVDLQKIPLPDLTALKAMAEVTSTPDESSKLILAEVSRIIAQDKALSATITSIASHMAKEKPRDRIILERKRDVLQQLLVKFDLKPEAKRKAA